MEACWEAATWTVEPPRVGGELAGSERISGRDGKLRQPVFLGLRDDKDPSEVTRKG